MRHGVGRRCCISASPSNPSLRGSGGGRGVVRRVWMGPGSALPYNVPRDAHRPDHIRATPHGSRQSPAAAAVGVPAVDQVAVTERAAKFTKRSIKNESKVAGLKLAMSMSTSPPWKAKTPPEVRGLCAKAITRPLPARPPRGGGGLCLPPLCPDRQGGPRRPGQGGLGGHRLSLGTVAPRHPARRNGWWPRRR